MNVDRRGFHLTLLSSLWALITGALAIPAAAYLFTPPRSRKDSEWIDAGDISRLPIGTAEEIVFRRNRVDGWKVTSDKSTAWVVRKSPDEVIAFAPQCTHLGCAYHFSENTKEFVCPCHTSAFALDGRVLTGPAPRPLDRFDVKLAGQRLLLGDIRKSEQA